MIVLKNVLSWVAVAAGLFLGVSGLVIFSASPLLADYEFYAQLWFYIAAAAILGVASLAASILALRRRKLAGWILLFGCLLIGICGFFARPYWLSPPLTTIVCASLLLLSGFWFWSHISRWPEFFVFRLKTTKSKLLVWGFLGLFLFTCVSLGAIKVTINHEGIGDCGECRPVSRPYPGQSVFTARVVHFDSWLGAVSVVQERFWGLPEFTRIVFLQAYAKPGDVFFVAGKQSPGLLTRYVFPVVILFCTRSGPIQYAAVDLRVLHDEPPKSGVRIIGQADGGRRRPIPGVNIIIDGPSGETLTTSDKDGIYDVSGLPPGQNKVSAYVRDKNYASRSNCGSSLLDLKPGDVGGCSLPVYEKVPD